MLTPEEKLAFEFALHWRDENYSPNLQNIDWLRFARLLAHNRMGILTLQILERIKISIPTEAQVIIYEQTEKYKRSASKLGNALTAYLKPADERDIKTIVLKGLWLCENVYQVPSMRPGGDIDILVHQDKVDKCLALLEEQDIGEYWPNLLHDDYFTRHHLHQQRCTPDLNIWFEIHWAFDHPYTLLTVDYEGIFERAKPSTFLNEPVQELSLPDLVLSLAIHLVKHSVYLPSLLDRADLPRIILSDGMLMYYLDIAEVINQNKAINWDLTIQLARDWGAADLLGSVLQVCQRYFNAPIPKEVLSSLPISRPWAITRKIMARAAEQELMTYEEKPVTKFWKFLLASNGVFILRPVRLLETASYFFPPSDFLHRRYGVTNIVYRIGHFFLAVKQTLRFGWDTVYFGIERYFRLKRLGKSASLFNKLDTHL